MVPAERRVGRATPWGAYKAIADSLRARISGGEFITGSALPSESALCAEYGVARNTLRRALDELAEEGLIGVRPGRGRVVGSDGALSDATPQYRRIAADLRAKIESGELSPGAALPSESAIVAQYGVARGTARQALAELVGAGFAEAVHGKGRFVRRR